MNIISICGSPNKSGSCAAIQNQILQKLKNQDHDILEYNLSTMKYSGCNECFQCRKNKDDKCFLKDDLSNPLEELKTADCAIISSPVFYADVSSQLKGFIDRTWSYFGKTGMSVDNPKMNRSLVFILTYGLDDNHVYDDIFEKYKKYFSMYGFTKQYFLKGYGAQYFDMEMKNQEQVNSDIDLIINNLLA